MINSLDATFFLFEAGPHISKWWPSSFFPDFLIVSCRRNAQACAAPSISSRFLSVSTYLVVGSPSFQLGAVHRTTAHQQVPAVL
jgi:hypothetical protein